MNLLRFSESSSLSFAKMRKPVAGKSKLHSTVFPIPQKRYDTPTSPVTWHWQCSEHTHRRDEDKDSSDPNIYSVLYVMMSSIMSFVGGRPQVKLRRGNDDFSTVSVIRITVLE